MNTPKKIIEPVIKWSGSKRQVALELSRFIPATICKRYFEPFLGGGSMLPFRKIDSGIVSDIIPELIQLWEAIKKSPNQTIDEYRNRWERLQTEGHKIYYDIRDNFNETKNPFDFLFLTRTCVNGLIRYNEKGEFNNSFHLTRPGIHPKRLKDIILMWSYYLQNVEFLNIDYRETLARVEKTDFIFLDPPYGGTKDRYTKTSFCLESFYQELERLNHIGSKWLLTFDGIAGERVYEYDVPQDLYQHKLAIKTGNSPFTKMMRTTVDAVNESVYLNFQPSPELLAKLGKQDVKEFSLDMGL